MFPMCVCVCVSYDLNETAQVRAWVESFQRACKLFGCLRRAKHSFTHSNRVSLLMSPKTIYTEFHEHKDIYDLICFALLFSTLFSKGGPFLRKFNGKKR